MIEYNEEKERYEEMYYCNNCGEDVFEDSDGYCSICHHVPSTLVKE